MAQHENEITLLVQAGVLQAGVPQALPGLEDFVEAAAPRPGLRYPTELLVLALQMSRGSFAGAARRLRLAGYPISATTLQNRKTEPAIAQALAEIKLQLYEAAKDIVGRAAIDFCLECGGTGFTRVEPKFVGDSSTGPCVVCAGTGKYRFEQVEAGVDDAGRPRYVYVGIEEDIDPIDQRNYALAIVRMAEEKADDKFHAPQGFEKQLSVGQMKMIRDLLKQGKKAGEAYRIVVAAAAPAAPLQLTSGPSNVDE